ncbi:MAG: DUF1990 domain-containing protein [Saprospiraceae bacterium]
MPTLSAPDSPAIRDFLGAQAALDFSYPGVGGTLSGAAPAGFDQDFNSLELGRGEAVWAAAKAAVRQWQMFPGGWAFIRPADTPIRPGEVVAMVARVIGIWWLNSCRIVYVLDDDRRFGFAYGTLPGHAECGEELFLVERDQAGGVRYSIRAFSQPRHWLARLGYPLARAYQRKFVRDSKASMQRFVNRSI